MPFAFQQILWSLILVGFLIVCYCAVKTFTRFRRFRPVWEVIACFVVFAFLLAFRVNF